MADLVKLREAYLATLAADATIQTLLGPIPGSSPAAYPIFYKKVRRESIVPAIVIGDLGTVEPDVPLHTRTIRADVFHTDFEHAEAIAARIRTLWDDQRRTQAGLPPVTATGWRIATFHYTGDGEEDVEQGDVIQRAEMFALQAYEAT